MRVLRSAQPVLQLSRHTIHFVGQVLWILALGALPLAQVFAVEFTSPIWGALTAVLLLGERLIVMAPRPGRIHKEYELPYADMGVNADLREVKHADGYNSTREEILEMIWNMEEEIMGRAEEAGA